MALESIFLVEKVLVTPLVLMENTLLALDIFTSHKKRFLFFFQAHFCLSELDGAVSVTSFLKFNFPLQVMVLTLDPLVVSSQSSVLTADLRVVVVDASQLPFGLVKSDLLRAKIV